MGEGERFRGNLGSFSVKELELVAGKNVCIVGCGALGGFTSHSLVRFGISGITLIDGDKYDTANLSRQLFLSPDRVGSNKAEVCGKSLAGIDPALGVHVRPVMVSRDNAADLIRGNHLVLDCQDNLECTMTLAWACNELNIPIVHAAVNAFSGQIISVFPGEDSLSQIYSQDGEDPNELRDGAPIFAYQLISSIQSCVAIKILAGRESIVRKRLLTVSMDDVNISYRDLD